MLRKIFIACCLIATPTVANASFCQKFLKTEGRASYDACWERVFAAMDRQDFVTVKAHLDPPEYDASTPESRNRSVRDIEDGVSASYDRKQGLETQGYVKGRVERLQTPCLSYGVCR